MGRWTLGFGCGGFKIDGWVDGYNINSYDLKFCDLEYISDIWEQEFELEYLIFSWRFKIHLSYASEQICRLKQFLAYDSYVYI